ncbi:MAG TPA: DAK2 domain-containing protein [Patescibacteria group bacterium]|nr:DAK2 domain-containing protein [Patescibacteria group bacterium]
MVRLACDGAGLLGAVRAAVANLELHVDEINALNVFPVPDGDTGSNMAATCREMLAHVRDDSSVDAVVERMREGALFGARGNSGVILSQVVRGLAEGFAGKRRFNGLDLAHALTLASTAAYGAVPRPVEGTMLTVIREASAVAVETAERSNDLEAVLGAATHAAARALEKTPSLLAVLREAGVVDSGGAGLLRLFEGALAHLRGEVAVPASVRAPRIPSPMPAEFVHLETGHGYETVYLIHPFPGQMLDLDRIRAYLVRTGESVNVAGDPKAAKIHVHNGRPDLVLRQALQIGRIVNATIMDLDHQTAEVRDARESLATTTPARPAGAALPGGPTDGPAVHPRVPLGIVAVAAGDGLAEALAAFGAADERLHVSIVRGGQAENPSAGQILAAIVASPGEEVVVLPNNPNVKLAAGQAAEMADRPVRVVPTRNAAEGIAALLEVDPAAGASANAEPMLAAGRSIQTFVVTEAVRDAVVSGRKVRRGQTMALDPDDGLLAADRDQGRAVVAGIAALEGGFSLVTLWYGDGADLADAERMARLVQEAWPAVEEVEVRHGGQPHYRYLVSVE